MGKTAIPFMLEEIKNGGVLWFNVLRDITGERDLIPEHKRGNLEHMRYVWLSWGNGEFCREEQRCQLN